MRDVDGGDANIRLQPLQLRAHVAAELRVEIGEWLVHQEDARPADHGAGERDALALSARKLARVLPQIFLEMHLGRRFAHGSRPRLHSNAAQLQRIADVLGHRHMGVERV